MVSPEKRLEQLQLFYKYNHRLPTYREAAQLWRIASTNAVSKIVHKLIERGFLNKDYRGRLTPSRMFNALSLRGRVPAGFPLPNEEDNTPGVLSLDDYVIEKPQASFLLTVTGDSMKDAGILPGDLAVIERTGEARESDIVLARVDGEWTLKQWVRKNGKVVLMPANADYAPIEPKEELTVYGVVRGIVRKYRG